MVNDEQIVKIMNSFKHKKKTMKRLSMVLAGLMLYATAMAQNHSFNQGPPPHRSGGSFVDRLDKDGDGKVSKTEFDGPSRHFKQLDRNGDGYISKDEEPQRPPQKQGRMQIPQQGMNPRQGQGFGQMPQMGQQPSFSGMNNQGSGSKQFMDVHGAGAQRSDPKSGDPGKYSSGHGPQGDVVRIYNYVRCVSGGLRNNVMLNNKYQVVDTGQSNCYDDGSKGKHSSCPSEGSSYFGQDAQYNGAKPSYIDNGDGTITDKASGLMWQKSFSKVSWANAEAAAKAAKTGGYSDWRVPTIKELYSLINFDGATGTGNPSSSSAPSDAIPYIDTKHFDFEYPTQSRYIDAQYVTSTSSVAKVFGGQDVFFGVNFADGRIKGYPKKGNMKRSKFYARFVRGNPDYGKNDFKNAGNGVVLDRATGLKWMKMDSGDSRLKSQLYGFDKNDGSLNWGEALQFCENLNYAGQSDWRLPNAKELQSIVDYTRSPDTTDSAAIDPIFSTTTIKDEGGSKDFPFYWTSTTHLDERNIGLWAIYVTFGEAHGYGDNKNNSGRQPQGGKPRRQ
jgi:hypothetical protein